MQKRYLILSLFFLGFIFSSFSQELIWKAGVHSFFDNTEFTGSKVQTPQTMAGVHLSPEIGLSWEQKHRIYIGADLLHEFGSDDAIGYYDPVVYYEYTGEPFRFYMGAIPRKILLDKYPRMFFQDSINNYRPVINGFFWEYNKEKNYINAWLDWTGRQSEEKHEAFFMGWSGRYNYKWLYAQHFGYMFHFAKKKDQVVDEAVHDNGLILTSLGVNFAKYTDFEKLEMNAGWSVGLDRDRGIGNWNCPSGFVSETKIEYKGIGLFNTLYIGDGQQIYYNDHGKNLYWGDSFYRLKKYDRADIFIHFYKSKVVNIKFVCSLHFAESNLYNQQSLYATFDLDNFSKKKEERYKYIWDNWF
ncbi:hypothetical protein LJB92_01150 [Bacteroidales bacterium OttesenSCG-928-M06]|nr:hypothetical protein [Bacteroidales bacterium OttesenSCG-928-M06]